MQEAVTKATAAVNADFQNVQTLNSELEEALAQARQEHEQARQEHGQAELEHEKALAQARQEHEKAQREHEEALAQAQQEHEKAQQEHEEALAQYEEALKHANANAKKQLEQAVAEAGGPCRLRCLAEAWRPLVRARAAHNRYFWLQRPPLPRPVGVGRRESC